LPPLACFPPRPETTFPVPPSVMMLIDCKTPKGVSAFPFLFLYHGPPNVFVISGLFLLFPLYPHPIFVNSSRLVGRDRGNQVFYFSERPWQFCIDDSSLVLGSRSSCPPPLITITPVEIDPLSLKVSYDQCFHPTLASAEKLFKFSTLGPQGLVRIQPLLFFRIFVSLILVHSPGSASLNERQWARVSYFYCCGLPPLSALGLSPALVVFLVFSVADTFVSSPPVLFLLYHFDSPPLRPPLSWHLSPLTPPL